MANTKKYVSLDKLSLYDEKIKKVISDADAAALASAKSYADGLATNYDAAGSAASALADAKTYADGKDAAIQAAKKAGDDAAAAALVADGKAVAAQNDVDALEAYVGTFTASEGVDTVVKYIDAKTANIASDETVNALTGRVTTVEGKVATIEGDYLKAADKNELAGDIADAMAAVDGEKSRAEGIEAGLRTDVDAIKGDYLKAEHQTALQNSIDAVAEDVADIVADYLKAADKTELEGKINAKAAQTALDAEIERATGVEEGLQNQINLIMNNPDTKDVIDSIAEFTQYVADHGEIADGFRTDINKNKDDIAAEVKRAGEAEAALAERLDVLEDIDHDAYVAADEVLAGRIKTLEDIDHDAYVAADTTLKNELNAEIAKKADATALASAVETLEGADNALSGRIATLEGKFTGDGSVADLIAAAKQEAIDAAAQDAASKAGAAETAAKGHADSLNTAMNSRVEALEAIDHDHANMAELNLIVSGDKAKWDEAYAKRHEHSNLSVLEGVTVAKVQAWDAAEGNAKTYADGLNTAMDSRVASIENWHKDFVECSETDINNLFA